MAGRRPTPTNLKVLAGNPGKRALPEAEPKPDLAAPSCPRHLDKEAKAEWKRIVRELQALRVLARIDRAGLAAYCQSYSRWAQAERELQKSGLVVVGSRGQLQKSPYVGIAATSLDQMRKFLIEFGLTPASRTKVQASPQPDADDDFFAAS